MSWAAIIPGAIELGGDIIGAVSGGSVVEKAAGCAGYRPPSDFAALLQKVSAGELEMIRAKYQAGNGAELWPNWNKPEWLAASYVGGDDCTISSTQGREFRRYLDYLFGKYRNVQAAPVTDWGRAYDTPTYAPTGGGSSGGGIGTQLAQISPVTIIGGLAVLWLLMRGGK